MEDIPDADYEHAKKFCKDFQISYLYHDLYVEKDTLLLSDVFENFWISVLKYISLILFANAPGLAWQAPLKKTKIKLDLLTDICMLLMVEKGITGGICHTTYRYVKSNNKFTKIW